MKYHIKPFSVLVLEDEVNLFVLVVHCLTQIKDVDIYVLSNKQVCETKYSRKIKNYSYYPKPKDNNEWLQAIDNEVDKHNIDVIMPVDEYGIETLIKHKNQLKNSDKLAILPSLDSFQKARDKGALAEHLVKSTYTGARAYIVKAGDENCLSIKICNFQF